MGTYTFSVPGTCDDYTGPGPYPATTTFLISAFRGILTPQIGTQTNESRLFIPEDNQTTDGSPGTGGGVVTYRNEGPSAISGYPASIEEDTDYEPGTGLYTRSSPTSIGPITITTDPSADTSIAAGEYELLAFFTYYHARQPGESDSLEGYFRSHSILLSGGTSSGSAVPSSVLAIDAHRRPLAVLGSTTSSDLTPAYSNDAGHSFAMDTAFTGSDPSLLVDVRQNTYRLIYYDGTSLQSGFGTIADGFSAGAGSPEAVAGASGQFPAAVVHPTDRDNALMAYLDGGDLKTASSLDAGRTWTELATVETGIDLSSSGRPALCFLGEAAFIVYPSGGSLVCRASPDRGISWGDGGTITSAAASGLSLAGGQGRLYLLASSPASLWISPDLGANWESSPGSLPTFTAPSAIGIVPQVAQFRLGITHYSNDDTLTWLPD